MSFSRWAEIEEALTRLRLDPRRLACGCAVKTDLRRVVYPAIEQLRPSLTEWGISIAPRQDADISALYGPLQIRRHVATFEKFAANNLKAFAPPRAVTLTSVYRAHQPQLLADKWLTIYRELARAGLKLAVGKGHTIEAYTPDDEFVLFDFFKSAPHGRPRGFLVANHDTIQLIDPTIALDDSRQAAVALSNALNDLCALGAVQSIQILPAIAAPTDELLQKIRENILQFAAQYGFTVIAQEPVSQKTLLLGATVFGQTDHQPPTFYHQIRAGDLVLVHRPFGDLAPINLHIESLIMGDGYLGRLGLGCDEVQRAKERVMETMAQPNLAVGQLIHNYSPALGEPFDPEKHIKATSDLSGPGIDIFRELAERARVNITLTKIPLLFGELVRAATKQYILPNGTAGTNGAIAVIAHPKVIERFAADLEQRGYQPQIIGHVAGPGAGILTVPAVTKDFISDWPNEYRLAQ